jgi:D-glycero-alpha-D-manno-heptose-7-phosphate kinase
MVITRTPFRVSFFGGGTDYPAWFRKHGGLVVGTTFQRYCYISCRHLPPFFEHKTRIVYSLMEEVDDPSQIKHPAIRGCLSYLNINDGLEIHHDGDLPARSGLGSSSSFTVGLLLSLNALRHQMPTKKTLADTAIKIEQDVIKENVGVQDQILAAFGGMQMIHISPNGEYEVRPMILPPDYLKKFEDHILLGFTGLTRFSTNVAGKHIASIENGTSSMEEIHSLARQGIEALSAQADFSEIGRLLEDGWHIKKSNADGVSNKDMDDLYQTARKAGAFGGKLLGAGGGGFFMFLAPPETHKKIKNALSKIKVWVPFKFDTTGAQVIFHTDEN